MKLSVAKKKIKNQYIILQKILGGKDGRGWNTHHWLNGHEYEQTPGDSEGQGSVGGNIYTTETGKHFSAGLFISLLVKQLPAHHYVEPMNPSKDKARICI